MFLASGDDKDGTMRSIVCLLWLSLLCGQPVVAGQVAGYASVSPDAAFRMVQSEPAHVHLVDVRTQPEYQFVGHPAQASNIPYLFWSGAFDGKQYGETPNPDFTREIFARFDPSRDTLVVFCRSGGRSAKACAACVAAGWPAERVFNLEGGFEGEMVKDKGSADFGQRKVNGWKNAGLPWTYDLDPSRVYPGDKSGS